MIDYLALIRSHRTGYAVRFPDFPTVITSGASMEEARISARDALAAHIAFLADEGLPIPTPSALDAVMTAKDNRDAVAVLLSVPSVGKTVRITATLDDRLVREIDALAAAEGLDRSGFLSEALRQHIATVRQAAKITAEVKTMTRARRRAASKRQS